ncbi:MAG: hypothetical protein ACK5SQ_01875 [Chitinophagales bacterium]
MSKKLLLFLSFLTYCWVAQAQVPIPEPCEPPGTTVPAENCPSACINCNFVGYMGNSGGWGGDPQPQGWCSNIQNDQWLGFIAGAAGATFTITPSNCAQGQGLQAAVYPAGCNDGPLECNPGCPTCGNTPTSFTVTNMVPGANYYLIIDGYSQDDCDFTISVIPPIAVQAPQVGLVSPISGPATGCPGGSATYQVSNVNGAGFYTWSSPTPGVLFNGIEGPVTFEAPGGRTVVVTYPPGVTGNITICVEPSNSCYTGSQRCRTINIQNLPPTVLPKAVICFEDTPYMLPWGDEVNVSGTYATTLTSFQGCDSIVRQQVQVLPQKVTNLTRFVCKNTCVTICGAEYCDQGTHNETCESYQGCDSTVNLILNVLDPIAQIIATDTVLSCANVSILLNSAASPNFPGASIKVWKNLSTGATQGGPTYTVTTPGLYTLTTTMSAGGIQCSQTDTIQITGNTIPPVATGVNGIIGCGSGPAQISVNTNGPVTAYSWSGPNGFSSGVQSPLVNAGGTYTVTVTSGLNGCTSTATAEVVGNTDPPVVAATGAVLTCSNPTPQISATSNTPSSYVWSNGISAANTNVNAAGIYVVTVTGTANNCTATATVQVTEDTALPGASSSVSGPIGCLSPEVNLNAISPANSPTYAWSGPGLVGNGQSPMANLAGVYVVTVTGQNGCTSTSSVNVVGNTDLPDASATGVLLSCAAPNGNVTASSTTSGVTYAWSVGGNTVNGPSATVTVPGDYVVTVTASNNCTQTATATADGDFVAPADVTATGAIINCGVTSVQISGSSSTPGVSYNWIGPGGSPYTGQTVTVSTVGTYVLTVQSTNGCTTTATADVIPDANIPNIGVVTDTISCYNPNATIVGSSTTSGVSFTWTGSGIAPGNQSNPIQTVSQSGLYTLTVVNPANNCSAVATAFVLLDTDLPGASAVGTTLTCTNPALQVFANSPSSNVTYAWSGPSFSSAAQNPTVNAAGTYVVTVTGDNGCTSTASAEVLVDQDSPVLSTAAATLTCAVTSVTINTTSSLPSSYAWTGPSFSSTNQNPSVQAPGTYSVVATAANGCTGTASITVNQDIATPDASATGGLLTCAIPTISLSGSSTTPGATFFWPQIGSNLQNVTVSTPGSYSLVVTGPNGCSNTVIATVNQNVEVPNIQINTPAVLTCSNLSSILQTTILTGTNTIQSIAWSNSASVEDPSVAAPGTYSVVVTLSNGCTGTASIQVLQDIVPPNATAVGGTLTCTNTSFNLNGGSTTPGASFSWSGGLSPVEDPEVSVNGSYTLTVTGPNGCTNTAVAQVAIDTIAPGATIASSNILDCDDLNATLTAGTTLGTSYVWSGPGLSNPTASTVTVNVPGTFTVQTTGANGCTSTASFNQAQDVVAPDASATGGTIDCISGAVAISGSSSTAGVSYAWVGPNNFTANVANPTVNTAGTYTLTVKAPNGCTSTTTAVVLANTLSPDATIQGSGILTCATPSINLTGITNTPNTNIEWTLPNGSNTSSGTIAATLPGTYTFTVTSQTNGCITVQTLTLGQNITPPNNVFASGGILDCANPTVSLQGGSGVSNATYVWIGPGGETYNGPAPVVSTAGTYTLVVTNPVNGCTSTSQATVGSSTDIPTISVTTETITCFVPTVVLNATSDVPNGEYTWTGPNNFTSSLEDPSTNVSGAYQVVVKNPANGCTSTFNIQVDQNTTLPNISAAGGQLTCAQPTLALQGSSTTPNVSYLWTAPGGITYNTSNPTVSEPGTYVLRVTDNVNGCTSTASAVVNPDLNVPVVTVTGGTLTCAVNTIQLTGQANKPDVLWSWTGPNFTSDQQNPSVTLPGSYTLVVTTPVNGCTGQASIVVAEDRVAPNVSVEVPDRLDCTTIQVGLSATVTGTGNFTFLWDTQNGTILSGATSSTPTVSQAGTYVVLVTNTSNGCTSTRTVDVLVDPAVPSAIGYDARDVSCFGFTNGALAISGVTGGTAPFVFSVDNQPFVPATAFNQLPPGTHELRVQDANGCEFETTFFIGEPAELLVNLGPDTSIRLGDAITLSLNNTVNYPGRVESTVLSPATLDTVLCATCTGTFEPPYSLQYTVTVVDTNGCRAEDTRRIIVDRTRRVYVPNVFHANSSGELNSILPVFGGNDVRLIKSWNVYDRWGSLVHTYDNFKPGDLNAAWNGKINGKEADQAVFVYALEVIFKDGETELFTGDVTLIR